MGDHFCRIITRDTFSYAARNNDETMDECRFIKFSVRSIKYNYAGDYSFKSSKGMKISLQSDGFS